MGCTAYWLLTGAPVFEGRPMEVILKQVNEAPVRPSERYPGLSVILALEEIVLECLEKDPARRPQSAAAVAKRLRGMQLPDPWTFEKAAVWWEEYDPVAETQGQADLLTEETIPNRDKTHVSAF